MAADGSRGEGGGVGILGAAAAAAAEAALLLLLLRRPRKSQVQRLQAERDALSAQVDSAAQAEATARGVQEPLATE